MSMVLTPSVTESCTQDSGHTQTIWSAACGGGGGGMGGVSDNKAPQQAPCK